MSVVLVVAAHPDDEVLGCGGTMAKLAHQGHEVHALILSTGRDDMTGAKHDGTMAAAARRACEKLGADVHLADFPDQRFDSKPVLAITQTVERMIKAIGASTVYTHDGRDVNNDHRVVSAAVAAAVRGLPEGGVRSVYLFRIGPWGGAWRPTKYVDISAQVPTFIDALHCYDAELRPKPHWRSLDGILSERRWYGREISAEYAEGFAVERERA